MIGEIKKVLNKENIILVNTFVGNNDRDKYIGTIGDSSYYESCTNLGTILYRQRNSMWPIKKPIHMDTIKSIGYLIVGNKLYIRSRRSTGIVATHLTTDGDPLKTFRSKSILFDSPLLYTIRTQIETICIVSRKIEGEILATSISTNNKEGDIVQAVIIKNVSGIVRNVYSAHRFKDIIICAFSLSCIIAWYDQKIARSRY